VDSDQLVLGLAAVFLGLTAFLVVVGLAVNPLLLLLALPFGGVAYLMWYRATGRLGARFDGTAGARARRTARARGGERVRDGERARTRPGADAGRRRARARPGPGGRGGRTRGAGGWTDRAPRGDDRPSAREAARTLGVSPDASEAELKHAYRRKVKEAHPDADGGTEEAFKRVTRAYDRLSDGD